MLKEKKEEEEKNATNNNESEGMSDEEIKKIVGSAIAQNPLVYRRLADI